MCIYQVKLMLHVCGVNCPYNGKLVEDINFAESIKKANPNKGSWLFYLLVYLFKQQTGYCLTLNRCRSPFLFVVKN